MTARQQLHLQQRVALRATYRAIAQHGMLRTGHLMVVGVRLVLLLVAHQPVLQLVPLAVHDSPSSVAAALGWGGHDGPVGLVHLAQPEHVVQPRQRLRRAGEDHKPADRAVQPVHDAQKHGSGLLVLLLDIVLDRFRQRPVASLVTLHDLAALFRDDDDVVVFINHLHNGGQS